MESELNMKNNAMKTKLLVCSKENNIRTKKKLKENSRTSKLLQIFEKHYKLRWDMQKGNSKENMPGGI